MPPYSCPKLEPKPSNLCYKTHNPLCPVLNHKYPHEIGKIQIIYPSPSPSRSFFCPPNEISIFFVPGPSDSRALSLKAFFRRSTPLLLPEERLAVRRLGWESLTRASSSSASSWRRRFSERRSGGEWADGLSEGLGEGEASSGGAEESLYGFGGGGEVSMGSERSSSG